jgi:hypothetical protein
VVVNILSVAVSRPEWEAWPAGRSVVVVVGAVDGTPQPLRFEWSTQ